MTSTATPVLETKAGRYRWHENWAKIPAPTSTGNINGRTHGVVVSQSGAVYIFHQAVPAVLVYSPEGKLMESWGDYSGAHGLTLVKENNAEFLWLADQDKKLVQKLSLDGKVVQELSKPAYAHEPKASYVPTWVAVNERRHGGNGDIWLADGYGSSRVSRYDSKGNYLLTLDGSTGAGDFKCPHGIAFDPRKTDPELYVADRGNHRVQVYDSEGKFKRVFGSEFLTSPDGFTFFQDQLIIPELNGRITILDGQDRLMDHLGSNEKVCSEPGWPDKTLLEPGKFNSPHGAAADAQGNIFIVEWRIGGRIIKLEKL